MGIVVLLLALIQLFAAQEHREHHGYQNYLRKNNLSRYCRQIAAELAIAPSVKAPIKTPPSWYFNYWEPNWACPLEERVMWHVPGSSITAGDGGKWICDVPALVHKKDCLVYSVGSCGEFSFEAGLLDLLDNGCDIHVFDIDAYENTHNYPAKYWNKIQRHHWGLGAADEVIDGKKLKTLVSTMRDLGHTGRTLHILKIDIEGGEFGTLDNPKFWSDFDASGSKIEQLLVEVHLVHARRFKEVVHETGAEMDNLLRAITSQGFVMFHKEINMAWQLGCEFAFLREHPNCNDFNANGNTSYVALAKVGH